MGNLSFLRPLLLLFLLLAACATAVPPASETPEVPDPAVERVRRLASILDYVAGDYAVAVRDGQVIDEAEYEEQIAFVGDARRLAAELASAEGGTVPELDARLANLLARVEAKAAPPEIAELARAIRRDVLHHHGLVLAPGSPPSFARGRELYAQHCALCHGESGAGDGPGAARLDPAPTDFTDEDVMLGLSPARAFNALTDGIEGTAMVPFSHLPAHERWSLAFYVVALRHAENSAGSAGKAPEDLTLADLAEMNDADLLSWLQERGVEGAEAADALAYLRRSAPFAVGDRPVARARELVRKAQRAYERGERSAALDAAISAYLDGFEPVEAMLQARDAGLVVETETAFLRLREAIARQAPAAEVADQAAELDRLLVRAEAELEGPTGRRVAFLASLTVMLREAIEALLLVFLLLGLVRRTGTPEDARLIHAGWIAAACGGLALWGAAQVVLPMTGASREVLEGVIALLAAVVLLYASHFVLARLDSKRRVEAIRRRLGEAGSGRRGLLLFSLSFMAVFREAFEVVLFLQAILVESPGAELAVLGGAASGLAIPLLLFPLLRRTGRRLDAGRVLTASGAILCALAVVLAGKGMRALQEAGLVSLTLLPGPRVDWLGIFPTAETLAAQGLVVVAIVAITLWGLREREPEGVSATAE